MELTKPVIAITPVDERTAVALAPPPPPPLIVTVGGVV
jgi:hypothetical protein